MKECVILTTCSTISKRSSKVALFVGLSVLMILVSVLPATAGAATVSLVSHANGNPSYSGNEQSVFSNIDVSGTKIVFYSNATNLTADNPNGSAQVYLYDTVTKMTKLISKAATGAPGGGNNDSVWPNIDPTGRYVVFVSAASNLTNPNAPSNYAQIYRYDTLNDEMKLISHAVGAPNTPGNEHSGYSGVGEAPSIDASGKRIAFISKATNLTASGPGSSAQQIYLYDADLATPISIITQNGNQDASTVRISTDGSSLVFRSRATNYPASPSNASSENHQVYWFGIDTGVMRLVSHKLGSTLGLVGGIASVQPYPDLSADGSKVVFTTYDTEVIGGTGVGEFTQVYLYDMNDPSSVQLITHAWDDENVLANQNSRCPRISKDGRFVSFQSNSTNLVGYNHGSSQSQVYRYNVADGYAELVSHVPSDVTQASTFMVTEPRLSGDGAVVAFQAQGNDLVDATFPSMMWNVFAAALHTPDPPVTYTLSFDKNTTDEVIGMPSSISAAVGFTVTIPVDIPTRAGYTFVGWNSDTDGDGEWFDPSGSYVMGDENATLYAIWEEIAPPVTYTLSFDKNTTDEVIGMPSSISAAVGFTVTIPADIPTRAGYTFVGWNSDTAGDGEWFDPSGSYVMGDENATLFAIWKLNIDIDDPNKMPDQPGKLGDTTSIIGLVTLLIASVTTTAISVKRNRKC